MPGLAASSTASAGAWSCYGSVAFADLAQTQSSRGLSDECRRDPAEFDELDALLGPNLV
jgi:hypothetical protein